MITLTLKDEREDPNPTVDKCLELRIVDKGFELLCDGVLVIDATMINDNAGFWVRKETIVLLEDNAGMTHYQLR